MTRTLFCLSMPGGHMSYIATLVSLMLGRLDVSRDYLTLKGSSHGANKYFPVELYQKQVVEHRQLELTKEDWRLWHQKAMQDYTIEGICVIKDSWLKLGKNNWQDLVNETTSIAIVSTVDDPIDWLYCWYNMVSKIPKHVHNSLRDRSSLYPKIWKQLSRKKKLSEMSAAMPLYSISDTPVFKVPSLTLSVREILKPNFPLKIKNFLDDQKIHAKLDNSIIKFHEEFSFMQSGNLTKALKSVGNGQCNPQGPFDEILCEWFYKGAIGLYSSPSFLSYQSGHGMVPSNALSRSVG